MLPLPVHGADSMHFLLNFDYKANQQPVSDKLNFCDVGGGDYNVHGTIQSTESAIDGEPPLLEGSTFL